MRLTASAASELDVDGDSYLACLDCDDADAAVNPAATELCDGLDNDCDGALSTPEVLDADGDGHAGCLDCDDSDAAIHPQADELCDGVDQDCDGDLMEGWGDGDDDGLPDCPSASAVDEDDGPNAASIGAPGGRVPVLVWQLCNGDTEDAELESVQVASEGSGHEADDVRAIELHLDSDGDGLVSPGDVLLATGAFPDDDSVATLSLLEPLIVPISSCRSLMVLFEFAPASSTVAAGPSGGAPLGLALLGCLASFGLRRRSELVPLLLVGLVVLGPLGSGCVDATEYAIFNPSVVDVVLVGVESGERIEIAGLPIEGESVILMP